MIEQLSAEHPVRYLCQLLDLPSSTYYYRSRRQEDDPELVKAIEQHLALRPYLGYRMLLARLRRDKWVVSERPVRRILRQMKRTRLAGRVITTDSKHSHPRFPNVIQDVTAVYPNHIWVGDITYLRYGRQFLYLAVILDAYTRAVRGWHLEELLTCGALTLPALQMALQTGAPTFFHSDQGRQYAAKEHVELLQHERERPLHVGGVTAVHHCRDTAGQPLYRYAGSSRHPGSRPLDHHLAGPGNVNGRSSIGG